MVDPASFRWHLPTHMRVKAPEVQLTTDFAEAASGVEHKKLLLDQHKK
jgi:hypothetical protein